MKFLLRIALALLATFLATQTSVAQTREFAYSSAMANMLVLESSTLALRMASTSEARWFAERMIDDHSRTALKLERAAKAEGVNLPTALDEEGKAKLANLQQLSGATFDLFYIAEQYASHETTVALFKWYVANGERGTLLNFAAETLPALQAHLGAVERLALD